MPEDVEGRLERRARDLDVRRPAAEPLVIGDRRGEHRPVDLREERGLRLGDPGRRRVDEPGARLAVGAHEALGRVRPEPFARRGEAREGARADRLADGGDDMADAVLLELLRGRPLLVDVAAVVDEDLPALELVPGERRIGRARGEEKAVLLVDLGEMDGRRPLALFQWTEALRGRRLGDVHRPAHEPLDCRLAGLSDRVLRLDPRLPQEATRKHRDEWRVDGGKARLFYS